MGIAIKYGTLKAKTDVKGIHNIIEKIYDLLYQNITEDSEVSICDFDFALKVLLNKKTITEEQKTKFWNWLKEVVNKR
ncbi:MAG: hypothetical protein M1419_00550 [Bacteroidetes bacterium]|nr:hypothetical protein [Bacteroidota bacterium]